MTKKLANDLMKKNVEYTKLKSDRPDGQTPRETPGRQQPGYGGLSRPDFESWTTEELCRLAAELEIPEPHSLLREALIDALLRTSRRG